MGWIGLPSHSVKFSINFRLIHMSDDIRNVLELLDFIIFIVQMIVVLQLNVFVFSGEQCLNTHTHALL